MPRSPRPRGRAVAYLGIGGTAVLSCLILAGSPASAQPTSAQSGYWSQAPADPETPSGGTEVASNPSGPTAVAAYRFEVPSGESADVLTLQVAFAQPASQVALVACEVKSTSEGWQPASGAGSFSNAPAADCSGGSVSGDVATDGSKVTFDLSRLDFAGGPVDVLVQPDTTPSPAPAGPSSSSPTFEVDFQPVSVQSLTTTGSPDASGTGSTAASPFTGSSFSGAPSYQPTSGAFSGAPVSPATGAPSAALSPALASTPGSGSAAAPPTTAAQALSPSRATTTGTVTSSQSEWRWRLELALGMVLVDLFAYMWYQQRTGHSDEDRPPLSIYDPPPAPRLGEGVAGGAGLA